MMRFGISEILDKVENAKTKKEKIKILRDNGTAINNTVLFQLLKIYFEDQEWDLPTGTVPYRASTFPDQHGHLYQNYKLIERHFLKDANPSLSEEKRKIVYIQFLENIDKDDAIFIESIRNGLMPYQSVTRKLIEEAFPGLLTNVEEKLQQ